MISSRVFRTGSLKHLSRALPSSRRHVNDAVHRAAATSVQHGPLRGGKYTTEIAGLPVEARPIHKLLGIYRETLESLQALPPTAVYRQSAEALTQDRIQTIERLAGTEAKMVDENAIEAIEASIGLGQIEEVIEMAEDELSLSRNMFEWKAWEDLSTKPEPGQWEYFKMPPSNTNATE